MKKSLLTGALIASFILSNTANALIVDISSTNINGTIFVDDSSLYSYAADMTNNSIQYYGSGATSGMVNVNFPEYSFNKTYDFGVASSVFDLILLASGTTAIEIGVDGTVNNFIFTIDHDNYLLSPGFYDHDNNPFTDAIYEGPTPGDYGPLLGNDWTARIIWADGVRVESFVESPVTFSLQASPVPVPPAVWLFGSGLLGLIGIARRKKAA